MDLQVLNNETLQIQGDARTVRNDRDSSTPWQHTRQKWPAFSDQHTSAVLGA